MFLHAFHCCKCSQNNCPLHYPVQRETPSPPLKTPCTASHEGNSWYAPAHPDAVWICKNSAWVPFKYVSRHSSHKALCMYVDVYTHEPNLALHYPVNPTTLHCPVNPTTLHCPDHRNTVLPLDPYNTALLLDPYNTALPLDPNDTALLDSYNTAPPLDPYNTALPLDPTTLHCPLTPTTLHCSLTPTTLHCPLTLQHYTAP